MDKISVIVPVYNGAVKLRRCIESILKQTFPSIELILVDDGSTDGSGKICDEYGENYKNVKVIHKNNGGVSSARNVGLEYATGSYIGFVDCDDFVESNMFQTMIDEIDDADLVMCGFYQNGRKNVCISCRRIAGKEDAISNIIGNGKFKGYLWNKLFRKSIIEKNNLSFFVQVHMCEDLLFCVQYIDLIKKVCLIPQALYHYEDNGDESISNGAFTYKKMSVIDAYENLLHVNVIMQNRNLYDELKWRKIRHCLSLWKELWNGNSEDRKQFLPVIKKEIKMERLNFLLARGCHFKHKLLFLLLKVF